MNEIRETKQYKATKASVPPSLGPDRGKMVVVKTTPHGVWMKPKGAQKNGVVFISWQEIYCVAVLRDAKEAIKG